MNPQEKLQELRQAIDKTDQEITESLAHRFKLTQQVGELKAKYKISAVDPERERRQFAKLQELANTYGLSATMLQEIWRTIINQVVANHKMIRKQTKDTL